MKSLRYLSGDDIRPGDRILFHREQGVVEFVVTGLSGDPENDWFFEEYPGGGVMIRAEGCGNTFLDAENLAGNEDLEFVSREEGPAE